MAENETGKITIDKTIQDEEVISNSLEPFDSIEYKNTVFVAGTINDVYQINTSKYSNWDAEDEMIVAVEVRVKNSIYVGEYNLSRQHSNQQFKKLLSHCGVVNDEPTRMIGERITVAAGSSELKVFFGDTNSFVSNILKSRIGNLTDLGAQIKLRYSVPALGILLSLLIAAVAIGGSLMLFAGTIGFVLLITIFFFTMFGIPLTNVGGELYHKPKNPNLV